MNTNNKCPLISIIIPTYKPSNFFDLCIESIVLQSFKNYEIIIVLNGCNEPYLTKIRNIIKKYPELNFNLIQTEEAGVSNARNIGLNNAKGLNIAFIDDDDIISSNYLAELYSVVDDNTVGVSNVELLTNDGIETNYVISKAFENIKENGYKNTFVNRRLLNSPCMKLYPTSIISNIRFKKDIQLGEDALFNFEISPNIGNLACTSNDAVYYYRFLTSSSSWSSKTLYELWNNYLKIMRYYFKIYCVKPINYNLAYFISRIIASSVAFISAMFKQIIFGRKN